LPVFKLGGGGVLGPGTQYFSFISTQDAVRAMVHLLQSSDEGPVNLVAPIPSTNQEFTTSLGKLLARPTLIPMPSFLVRALFGQMGEEMLLGGVVACPKKLMDGGFVFEHPNIDAALQSALIENS
jgi:NAD dependent epimerase/dehydratase family enzyme